VKGEDLLAEKRTGKQVMNIDPPTEAALCVPADGDSVAVIGENRKLLVFPIDQVPEMSRGRGVQLQAYRDGGLSDAKVFNRADGLTWALGDRTRTEVDLRPWLGNRAGAGKAPPNGFPRGNRFDRAQPRPRDHRRPARRITRLERDEGGGGGAQHLVAGDIEPAARRRVGGDRGTDHLGQAFRVAAPEAGRGDHAVPAQEGGVRQAGLIEGRHLGQDGQAVSPDWTSRRSVPARRCGSAAEGTLNIACTRPATRSSVAGGKPREGTCTRSSPRARRGAPV